MATSESALPTTFKRRPSVLRRAASLAIHKPLGTVSLVMILLMVLAAVFANVVAPYDPFQTVRGHIMSPPSSQFLFGTDNLGRDILSRIIYGARISLTVGFGAVGFGVTAGTIIGLASAFFSGKFDILVQRYMDAQSAFPSIILALAVVAALGPSIMNVIIAIGIADIPRANRIVRGSALSEMQRPYVEAAKAIGARSFSIMFRH